MPGTGGPLRYLSEAYGPKGLGRLMSFLFIWQTIFLAPLSIASGAIGFSQYARFFSPHMGWWQEKGIAMAVCLLITFMLYRDIRAVERLSVGMWIVVLATVGWITIAGLLNLDSRRLLDFPPGAFAPSRAGQRWSYSRTVLNGAIRVRWARRWRASPASPGVASG